MITLPWVVFIILLVVVIYLTMWLTIGVVIWADKRDDVRKTGGDPDEFFPFNWRLLLGPEVYWEWVIRRLEEETAKIKARTAEIVAETKRRNGG